MSRQSRKIPGKLTRFNYWNVASVVPQDADELKTFSPEWVRRYSLRLAHEQFNAHLSSTPCGVAGCNLDEQIRNITLSEHRAVLALKRYVETNSVWRQDTSAQTILTSLPPIVRAEIVLLDQKTQATRKRNWASLLRWIARDQQVFQAILEERCAGDPASISDPRGLSEAQIVNIYRAYSAQCQRLLGKVRSHRLLNMLKRRGIDPTSLSRPVIPQRKAVDSDTEDRRLVGHNERGQPVYEYASSPMFDCDGKLIDYDRQGELIEATTQHQMLLHWFAHALRNLSRYFQGNPPLPFQDGCAGKCLKERDRLAK